MVLYVIIAIQNLIDKDYPHFVTWIAYAIANLGMLWYELLKYYEKI
jgi:hypothetical protein